jgi:hypothetical protein
LNRYYHVDFSSRELTWRADYHAKTEIKSIYFNQILSVDFVEDDVAEVEGLKFSFPFKIETNISPVPTILYSRSHRERDLWLQVLGRAIDLSREYNSGELSGVNE